MQKNKVERNVSIINVIWFEIWNIFYFFRQGIGLAIFYNGGQNFLSLLRSADVFCNRPSNVEGWAKPHKIDIRLQLCIRYRYYAYRKTTQQMFFFFYFSLSKMFIICQNKNRNKFHQGYLPLLKFYALNLTKSTLYQNRWINTSFSNT